jgi:hypothetical protein
MVRGMIHNSIKGLTPKGIQDRIVLDYHSERELKAAAPDSQRRLPGADRSQGPGERTVRRPTKRQRN